MEGHWIFGMFERDSKKFRLEICPDNKRDQITLLALLEKHVERGTIIYSDMWRGYHNIHLHGYFHRTVNHSVNFVDPLTQVHTNSVEANWRPLKNRLQRGGIGAQGKLSQHLCEYLWMRSHRDDDDIFLSFIKAISRIYNVQ